MAAAAAAGLVALPFASAARADVPAQAGKVDHDAVCFAGLSYVNTVVARRGDKMKPEQRRQMALFRFAIPFYAARLSANFDDDALAAQLAAGQTAFADVDDKGAATVACYDVYKDAMKRVTGALQAAPAPTDTPNEGDSPDAPSDDGSDER